MNIRKMRKEDIDFVYHIGSSEKNFQVVDGKNTFWSKAVLTNWMKSEQHIALVAEENNALKGFILAAYDTITQKAELENIWVKPEHRKKGLGTKLIVQCIEELKLKGAKYVCALTKDESAAIFFQRNTFLRGKSFEWMVKQL